MDVALSRSVPIFIFATGQRCGSTLLQRFLCSHPRIMIWGEHGGTLTTIQTQFEQMLAFQHKYRHQLELFLNDGVNHFIANMNPIADDFNRAQVQLIEQLWRTPANRFGRPIWGFKEVRYDAMMALHLRHLFPGARVIYLTRNIIDCFISLLYWEDKPGGWTRANTLNTLHSWITINRSFQETSEIDPAWVFSVTYEQLTRETETSTRRLTDWLELDLAEFDLSVFEHKIFTDRYTGADLRPKIERSDLSDADMALLTTEEICGLSRLLGFEMPRAVRNSR